MTYDPTSHIPATRITPDQILPDVGGRYRDRKTGEIVTLWDSVEGRIAFVQGDRGKGIWMHWDEFWRTYIHSEARP